MPWFITRAFLYLFAQNQRKSVKIKNFYMKKIRSISQGFFDKIKEAENEKYCNFEFAITIQKIYFEFVDEFLEFEKTLAAKSPQHQQVYFSEIKPNYLAHFIFARKILEIESNLTIYEDYKEVLKVEHDKIHQFKNKHFEQLEKLSQLKQVASADNCSLQIFDDHLFRELSNTLTIDLLLAFLIANEKIEIYLFKIEFNKRKHQSTIYIPLEEPFTKTDICELSYAIHELKGKRAISLKELALRLCNVFGVEPFNPYDLLRDIANREENKTKLLNKLKNSLLEKINSLFK
jgi:hypothetical protein